MNVLCWVSSASNGGGLDVVDVLRCLCHTSARAAKYVCADLHVLLRVVAACSSWSGVILMTSLHCGPSIQTY